MLFGNVIIKLKRIIEQITHVYLSTVTLCACGDRGIAILQRITGGLYIIRLGVRGILGKADFSTDSTMRTANIKNKMIVDEHPDVIVTAESKLNSFRLCAVSRNGFAG